MGEGWPDPCLCNQSIVLSRHITLIPFIARDLTFGRSAGWCPRGSFDVLIDAYADSPAPVVRYVLWVGTPSLCGRAVSSPARVTGSPARGIR